jgi:hypothetical protein
VTCHNNKIKKLIYISIALLLILPPTEQLYATSSKDEMEIQKTLYNIMGGIFTIGAAVDTYLCIYGDKKSTSLLIKGIGPCIEAVLAAAFAIISFVQASKVDKDIDDQVGPQSPVAVGAPTTPPTECTADEIKIKKRLERFVAEVECRGCSCVPTNPLVNENGDITNPDLALSLPDAFKDDIKKAVQKGSPTDIVAAGDAISNGAFSKAGGAKALSDASEAAANSQELAAQLGIPPPGDGESLSVTEGGKKHNKGKFDHESGKGGGKFGGTDQYITAGTKLGPSGKNDKNKKGTSYKGNRDTNGVVQDKDRLLFVVITRRYNTHAQNLNSGNL